MKFLYLIGPFYAGSYYATGLKITLIRAGVKRADIYLLTLLISKVDGHQRCPL